MKKTMVKSCENELCLYFRERRCILDRVAVNELGYCDAFLLVQVPGEMLDSCRKRQLLKLEQKGR